MSEVSLNMFYFALFDDGLTLTTLKLALIGFLIQSLQSHNCILNIICMQYDTIYILYINLLCNTKC